MLPEKACDRAKPTGRPVGLFWRTSHCKAPSALGAWLVTLKRGESGVRELYMLRDARENYYMV